MNSLRTLRNYVLSGRRRVAARLPHQFRQYYQFFKLLRKYKVRAGGTYGLIFQTNGPLPVLQALPFEPRVIVDAGANEGAWTAAYHSVVGSSAAFHLIEPLPSLAAQLERRFHAAPNVLVHPIALSSAKGSATLNVARSADFSSLEVVDHEIVRERSAELSIEFTDQVVVPTETLTSFYDAVLPDKIIDLLKLDVQGHEVAVLEHGEAAMARTRALLVEWNIVNYYDSPATFSRVHELLVSLGFDLLWIPFQFAANNQLLYADALYLNRRLLSLSSS